MTRRRRPAPRPAPPPAVPPALVAAPVDLEQLAEAAVARALEPRTPPCTRCGIRTDGAHPAGWCRACALDAVSYGAGDDVCDADDLAAGVVMGLPPGVARIGGGKVLRHAGVLVDFAESGAAAPNGRRWAHVDAEAAAAAWDRHYGADDRPRRVLAGPPIKVVVDDGPLVLRDRHRPPTPSERAAAAEVRDRSLERHAARRRAARAARLRSRIDRDTRRLAVVERGRR